MARKPANITTDIYLEPGELTNVTRWQRAECGFSLINITLPNGDRIESMVSVYHALDGTDTAGILLIRRDETTTETLVYSVRMSGVVEEQTSRYATPSEVYDRLVRGGLTFFLRATGRIPNNASVVPEELQEEWMDVPIEFEEMIITAENMAGQGAKVEIDTQD